MAALIDTHCHLADQKFAGDLDAVLQRADEAGIRVIVAVGALGSVETNRLTVAIAERHQHVYAAIGVHPHDAKDCDERRMAGLREMAAASKVAAIGETGLDFHYLRSPPEAQETALRRHLALADEAHLPVVIHCRDAEERLIEIVRECGMPAAGGMIHCFTGGESAARDLLALGFYISFSGIVTFKNAAHVRETARLVPSERLLVETDAPYLAPEPWRGKRNEPAFVRRTLEVVAAARGLSSESEAAALCAQVMANAARLFGFTPPA